MIELLLLGCYVVHVLLTCITPQCLPAAFCKNAASRHTDGSIARAQGCLDAVTASCDHWQMLPIQPGSMQGKLATQFRRFAVYDRLIRKHHRRSRIHATAQGGWPEQDGCWNEQVCEEDITYQTTGGACMLPLSSCDSFAMCSSLLLTSALLLTLSWSNSRFDHQNIGIPKAGAVVLQLALWLLVWRLLSSSQAQHSTQELRAV